jgi:uncharacterized protein (TIGR02246 family)
MLRSLLMAIVCAALISCVATQPEPAAPESDIHRASDRFWAARQNEDLSSFVDHFTEDGILMIPGLPDAVGRSAIRGLMETRFASLRTSGFTVRRREVRVVGDAAYELAWYSEITHGAGDSMRMEGRYLNVWSRGGDGVWRVHRNVYNFSGATPVSAPE